MSERLPVISGKHFIKFLQKLGFTVTRINGFHHRMKHADGRVTTVPLHRNDNLPKGLLRKIIREDLKLEQVEFNSLFDQYGKS